MKIAMTHEQADFDAIASLFAVSRFINCFPLLPRNINHNVRSFLILYGSELPFLDQKDLADERISDLYLVDTQSLLTIRGVTRHTNIHIYDHHPIRDGKINIKDSKKNVYEIEPDLTYLALGATTTYFVEMFQEVGITPTPLQATLMLLGIYEDTGTLTYGQTQPRDIRAAAWLLEQGAYLKLLPDFLNPPLTDQQKDIYDQLMANHQYFRKQGFNIIFASAEVLRKVDEISTIAHKLRDFFDPDAIFIAVKTPEGVRIIGRSQTDDINIAEFMRKFGGGGHIRAGSALTQKFNESLDWQTSVQEELAVLYDSLIRPSLTVAKLMSRKPILLDADADIHQAESLMIKYGYEGFPVVRHGVLIGLLTRRAVDRAKRHKLNLKVASIMEEGDFTVAPNDPIQTVQTVMTESGWGQIPVMDGESKKIVGIVTRTDLIKILVGKKLAIQNLKRIEETMESNVPEPTMRLIRAIANVGADLGLPIYLVGGFVRDLLLNQPSTDLDVVVEGDAIQLGKKLTEKLVGELKTHTRFGTGRWYLYGSTFGSNLLTEFIDLISARQEFYEKPTALPSVESGNIKHDLHRRDFTINTLAIRLDGEHFGELHDYYSGERDLIKKQIRVLHSLSFIDDPTRMVRAARYEGRYGFAIENRTRQLVSEALPLLSHLSQERIRHEIDLVLLENNNASIIHRLAEWGVLEAICTAIPRDSSVMERIELSRQRFDPIWSDFINLNDPKLMIELNYSLWFANLSKPELEAIQTVFGFAAKVYDTILDTAFIIHWIQTTVSPTRYDWYCALNELHPISLYAGFLMTKEEEIKAHLRDRKDLRLAVNGKDLAKLGIKPGPVYQEILNELLKQTLNENLSLGDQVKAYQRILMEKNLD